MISILKEKFKGVRDSFAKKFGDIGFVVKLRSLPEQQKKIIFFAVIGVSVLIIGAYQVVATKRNIAKIGQSAKSMQFPEFSMPDDSRARLPNFDFFDVSPGDQPIMQPGLEANNNGEAAMEKEPMR